MSRVKSSPSPKIGKNRDQRAHTPPSGAGRSRGHLRQFSDSTMTLQDLLQAGADDAIAIAAPGRAPLDYRGLRGLVVATTASLNAAGIGRNDRVAIVLPNGPEMATCFVACAAAVASAPLNPAYRADEFEFYLVDLQRQGADRRARQHLAGGRRWRASWACRSSSWRWPTARRPASSAWARDGAAAPCASGGPAQRGGRGDGAAHLGHDLAARRSCRCRVANLCASAANIAAHAAASRRATAA